MNEKIFIIAFVMAAIVLPIFIGIIIGKAWSEIDPETNNIINQTINELNSTNIIPHDVKNYTQNVFEGKICSFINIVPPNLASGNYPYFCHST